MNTIVDSQLKSREEVLLLLKENLKRAQERMEFFADKKRTKRQF